MNGWSGCIATINDKACSWCERPLRCLLPSIIHGFWRPPRRKSSYFGDRPVFSTATIGKVIFKLLNPLRDET